MIRTIAGIRAWRAAIQRATGFELGEWWLIKRAADPTIATPDRPGALIPLDQEKGAMR